MLWRRLALSVGTAPCLVAVAIAVGMTGTAAPSSSAQGVTPTPFAGTCLSPPLGVATQYNVFTLGDAQFSGGIQGRAAFGGNATLTGIGIATQVPPGSSNVLVVGGTLTASNAATNNGNVVVGGRVRSRPG